jgi:hypothetical protein
MPNHPRTQSAAFPAQEPALSKNPKEMQKALADAKFKRKEVQARDGAKAMAEYEASQAATRAKTAKLKALREAKEAEDLKAAAEAPPAPAKKSAKKKA